jgi:hypothetical protein
MNEDGPSDGLMTTTGLSERSPTFFSLTVNIGGDSDFTDCSRAICKRMLDDMVARAIYYLKIYKEGFV